MSDSHLATTAALCINKLKLRGAVAHKGTYFDEGDCFQLAVSRFYHPVIKQ